MCNLLKILSLFLLFSSNSLGQNLDDTPRMEVDISERDLDLGNVNTSIPHLLSWGNSSGGGEYIIDKNNPWFTGSSPITWCIQHGGESQFSLSKEKAQVEIEKALNDMLYQLKVRFSLTGGEDRYNNVFAIAHAIAADRKTPLKTGVPYLSETRLEYMIGYAQSPLFHFPSFDHKYKESCQNVELKFILGDTKSGEAQTLLKGFGIEKFRRIGGIAVRNDYNNKTLRGRGFIYIAADKGPLSYSGEKNIYLGFDHIWNNHDTIREGTPIPERHYFSYYLDHQEKNFDFKEQTIGPLRAVVAHELGHVIGLEHVSNVYQNNGSYFPDYEYGWQRFFNVHRELDPLLRLMEEDFPASVIKMSVLSKGNYNQIKQNILMGSYSQNEMMQWDWYPYYSKYYGLNPNDTRLNSLPSGREVYELFGDKYDEIEVQGELQTDTKPGKVGFSFILDPKYTYDKKGRRTNTKDRFLHILSFESTSGKYKYIKSFPVKGRCYKTYLFREMHTPRVNIYQRSTLRVGVIEQIEGELRQYFDEELGQWISESNSIEATVVKTLDFLRLGEYSFCERVELFEGQEYQFLFQKNYLKGDSITVELPFNTSSDSFRPLIFLGLQRTGNMKPGKFDPKTKLPYFIPFRP